jgi:hypothetical protein
MSVSIDLPREKPERKTARVAHPLPSRLETENRVEE